MTTSSQTKGMLSTEAGRKSFFATLVDLYKSDLAFRGMTDFAVIGAIVMMFLHPPHLVSWPWTGAHVGGGGQTSSAGMDPGDTSAGATAVAPSGSVAAGPVVAIPYPDSLKNPRLGIGFLFDIDAKAFDSSSAEDQKRLKEALVGVVERDPDVVIESLREADGDDPNVALLRGAAFVMRNTEASNRTGAALWRQAVNDGSVQAKALLGRLLISAREGVAQDTDQGRRLIEQGAAAGDPQALRFLGIGYLAGDLGVLDPAKAADTLKQAADAGDAMAMGIYSRLLAEGIGVPASDGKQAEQYLRSAAEAGLTFAQRALGDWLIAQYSEGLAADPKEAVHWQTMAYEKGHDIDGLTQLTYIHGALAKKPPWKDVKRAMDFVRLCSGYSSSSCQFNTGVGWKGGHFGARNLLLARAHFAIADSLGYGPAAKEVRRIDDQLSPEQKQEAEAHEKRLRADIQAIPKTIPLQNPDAETGPPPKAVTQDIKDAPETASNAPEVEQTDVSSSPEYAVCADADADIKKRGAACGKIIDAGKGSPDELATAYFGRGWMKDQQKKNDEAIADYSETLKLNPKHAAARNNRASLYMAANKLDLAHKDLDFLIEKRPDYKFALANRAEVLRQAGKLKAALADADKALAGDPNYSWAKTVRGKILADMKKKKGGGEEQGQSNDQTSQFGPDDPPSAKSKEVVALRKRALSHVANKDYDSAIADYTDIIRAGNASWLDYDGRAIAYHFKKEYDAALADYGRAIERRGHNALVHYNRALIFKAKGDTDKSLAELDAAIEKHKTANAVYFLMRGDLLVERSRYDKAIKDFDQFVDIISANKASSADDKAFALYKRGKVKVKKVLADQEHCLRLIPTPDNCNAPTAFMLPLLDLEAAVAVKPDYAQAHLQIGWVAEKFGNKSKAIDAYTKAIKADPTFSTAYNNRGVIYGNMGQKELAFADYNDAIRNDPNNYFAWANRGVLFATQRGRKNRRRAISDLRRSLQIKPDYGYAIEGLRKMGVKR